MVRHFTAHPLSLYESVLSVCQLPSGCLQSLVSALQSVHAELGSVREWLDRVSAAVPSEEDVPDANQELDSIQVRPGAGLHIGEPGAAPDTG